MSKQTRGFILGFITCILIFSLIIPVASWAGTKTATVTYRDIKVYIDSVETTLKDLEGNAIEPVILFDTVYVPLSPLARAFGKSSTWDGNANAIYIGPKPTEKVNFMDVAPPYDVSNKYRVTAADNVTMGGTKYNGAVQSSCDSYSALKTYSLHNLNGNYNKLVGYIGHVDGTAMGNAVYNFYGDGKLLAEYDVKGDDFPKQISLNVTGIKQLKIEIVHSHLYATFAFAGATLE